MIINMNGAKAPETPSPVMQEKTVTPETLPTVIGADEGYDGLSQVTVNPDSKLIPTNIRSGKTIFGVTGTFGTGDVVYDVSDITLYPGASDQYSTGIVAEPSTNGETVECEVGTCENPVAVYDSRGVCAISFGNTYVYSSSAFDYLMPRAKYYYRVNNPTIPTGKYKLELTSRPVDGYAPMPNIPIGTSLHLEMDLVYKPAIFGKRYGTYDPIGPVSETVYNKHVSSDMTVGPWLEFEFDMPAMTVDGTLECVSNFQMTTFYLGYYIVIKKLVATVVE